MTRRRRLLAWLGLSPWLPAALPERVAAQPAPSAAGSRRLALVIGNGPYAQAMLPNPENDARLIASTLGGLGFEVDLQLNLKTREFRRVLREFGRRMEDDQTASVFYYAGHAVQIAGRNYLLPVDLNLRDEGEVKDEAIDLQDTLLSRIDRVRPRARIFIVDACRDNPFADPARATAPRGLAEMAAPGALIAFSAAPGSTAEDGPAGGNSVYTRHLARAMLAEGVEVEEMLKTVRIQVLRETQERQIPWVNTSMVVNFAFNPGASRVAGARPAPVSPANAAGGARSLRLTLLAGRQLNTDRQDAPASLALRVFLLRDGQAFQRASFDSLYDNDEATLGATLLRREAVHLRPGEQRDLVFALGNDARVVAVFAAYRELDRTQWRAQLAIPGDEVVPPARLDALARQVQLAWVH